MSIGKYESERRKWEILLYEEFDAKSDAMRREKELTIGKNE